VPRESRVFPDRRIRAIDSAERGAMPSSHDCEVDVVRMWERYLRITAAVVFGAFLLILAGTIGALLVVDRRAEQAFDSQRRIAHDARPRAAPAPASTSAAAAPAEAQRPDSALALDAMPDAQENPGHHAHHGRRKHGRRFAHWRSHGFGFFAGR